MGRELRRVPLDFDWPLNKTWEGFLNPHYQVCPAANQDMCFGGATPAARWLDSVCRLIALIGNDSAMDPNAEQMRVRGMIHPHPNLQQWPQAPFCEMKDNDRSFLQSIQDPTERNRALWIYSQKNPPKLAPLTTELSEFIKALAQGEEAGFFSRQAWKIEEQLRKAAGIGEDWGTCKVCGGDGIDPAAKEAYKSWEKVDPPTGEGWQLWETTSEGSPISPVLPTQEAFVDYLVSEGWDRVGAEKFVDVGWAPTFMIVVPQTDNLPSL